jgi:methionyl-tRNA synthetase
VLDPTDLIEPRSAVSGSTDIEVRDSKHLFLRQSDFADRLRSWIGTKQSVWSNVVSSIAYKWLDEGLRDRGITRDLNWGVPVDVAGWGPNPAGETLDAADWVGKVFYVWFDAPIEYIGATREWADANGQPDAWQRWWQHPAADDVTYVEFMGKDNVPFHTVGFPATLMGVNTSTKTPWKLVDQIKGFNWLTYYGGKFSTSQKRGVFMDQALDLLPPDTWRWYLVANAPESADTSFTWEHFAATVNKDLADVLGNFVNRILKFATARFEGKVPDGGRGGAAEAKLCQALERGIGLYTVHLEEMQFRKAAQELRAIWVAANEFVAEAAPWTVIKTDPAAAAASVRTAINLIALIAALSAPIIPDTAHALASALGLGPESLVWPKDKAIEELARIPAGQTFQVPDVLFTKIAEEQVAEWTQAFGGSEAAP